MKLSTIAALITLTGTDAIYYQCCKTPSETCPGMMKFNDDIGAFKDDTGEDNKMCCQPDLASEEIPTENFAEEFTCIDDAKAENGMSISVMAIGVPEPAATTTASKCCEVSAAAEPGKLRSSAGTSCPINMFSIDGLKGPKNNPLCCEVDGTNPSDIDLEGIDACAEAMVTTTTEDNDLSDNDNEQLQEGEDPGESQDGEPSEGQEVDAGNDSPPQGGDSTGSISDAQQSLEESNSASAASAAFVVALLGAAIQVAL